MLQNDGNVVVYSADGLVLWDRLSASTPAPTPTPTPTPGGTDVIGEGGGSIGVRRLRPFPFTTTATGTIGVTVDWTFATNDVDIYLARGTNPCTVERFNADTCSFLGFSTSMSVKPETLSVPSLAAGPYTTYVGNRGPTPESIRYQVTLTRVPAG